MTPDVTSARFFDDMYLGAADPWNFAGSEYELARYEATVAALDHRCYGRAFEPGCSIGVLTERLARICDSVEAIDISSEAVRLAQERCREISNVTFACATLADFVPAKELDLIVLSEIGYYFSEKDLSAVACRLVDGLQSRGTLLAVHWLGESVDHVLHGNRVHEILLALPGLTHEISKRHDIDGHERGFRLDRWIRG